MTKEEVVKCTEPFTGDIPMVIWCDGMRHHLDTIVYEIAEDDEVRLVLQPGPPVVDNAPKRATPLFGRGE